MVLEEGYIVCNYSHHSHSSVPFLSPLRLSASLVLSLHSLNCAGVPSFLSSLHTLQGLTFVSNLGCHGSQARVPPSPVTSGFPPWGILQTLVSGSIQMGHMRTYENLLAGSRKAKRTVPAAAPRDIYKSLHRDRNDTTLSITNSTTDLRTH